MSVNQDLIKETLRAEGPLTEAELVARIPRTSDLRGCLAGMRNRGEVCVVEVRGRAFVYGVVE